MFLVNDNQKERHEKIISFLCEEPAIAVLLSIADLEWTLRRAILALGTNPTKYIRENTLKYCSGLQKYKDAWKEEVTPRTAKRLPEIINNWEFLSKQAYPLRHKLIHGIQGTVGTEYATERVNSAINASLAIIKFAYEHDKQLYKHRIVRYKKVVD